MRRQPRLRFIFRLGLALGIWDIRQLLRDIDLPLLEVWEAYFSLEPWGGVRGDYQAAIVARTVAQVHARRGHRHRLQDFMLEFDRPAHPSLDYPSPEDWWEKVKASARVHAQAQPVTDGSGRG